METGRGVRPGGGGRLHLSDFSHSVDPISIRGSTLCPPHYYLPPPPDFQTFLLPTLGRHRELTSGGKMMILLRPFSSLLVTSTGAGPVMIRIPG